MNAIAIGFRPEMIDGKRANDQLDNLDMHCCIRNLLALGFDLNKNSPSEFHHAYYQLRHELIWEKEQSSDNVPEWKRERAQCG